MSLPSAPQAPIPASATVASIHQPHYLPWLGLLAKIACSDVFIYLDNVQFEKNGWQNRQRYSTDQGLKFLSLPVQQQGVVSGQTEIREVRLADPRAPLKHWKTLFQRYGKRPGWPRLAPRLESILLGSHEKLISLCLATTALTLEVFQVEPRIVFASEVSAEGQKTDRVVNLVKAVSATHYLSGAGAREYLDPTAFGQNGLGLTFQEFTDPIYPQSTSQPFTSGAFALEWYIEDPDNAAAAFHEHLRRNAGQPPRCLRRGINTRLPVIADPS